jgi:hypothetical protein
MKIHVVNKIRKEVACAVETDFIIYIHMYKLPKIL